MIRRIIFFSCILFQFTFYAQTYFHFPDSNTVWTVLGAQSTIHTIYAVKGDSVCKWNVYNKYDIAKDTNLNLTQFSFYALVREDGATKRIYGIKHNTNVERLLYDFSLNVNDTLSVYSFDFSFTNDKHKNVVTSIDSILVNSVYRKRFNLTSINYTIQPCMTEQWVEGIGSLYGLFYSGISDFCVTDFYFPVLLCQKQKGILNYIYNACNTCFANPCLGVWLKELDLEKNNLKVYPNPANSILNLELSKFIGKENYNIKIINIIGETIFEDKSVEEINVSELKSGIYFLQLYYKKKLISVAKIIKE